MADFLTGNAKITRRHFMKVCYLFYRGTTAAATFSHYKFTIFKKKLMLCFKVKSAAQQTGFIRQKRGYKPINSVGVDQPLSSLSSQNRIQNDMKLALPTDPDFNKEWYLVSILTALPLFLSMCATTYSW